MTIPNLTYRSFRRSDLPGVLKLWEFDSGWGSLTEELFDVWYVDTPHGESIITVAVDDEGKVYGQEVFFPMRTVVGDRVVRSLHLSAPILDASLRGERVIRKDHPVIWLYGAGLEEAVRQQYELMYATPQRAWLPFFKWVSRAYPVPDFLTAAFGCAARPLDGALPAGRAGSYAIAPTKTFGPEYDELWETARTGWPITCGNVRDAKWVDWRNGDHTVLEVRDPGGALAGYLSLRKDGLVIDVLSRERDELAPLIGATIEWLQGVKASAAAPVPSEIKLMRQAVLEPAIEALGFQPVDFEFGFCCNTFGETIARSTIEPDRWYVMPLY